MALGFSHSAISLGLGDLAEKSVIGEPLQATLAITGEEKFPLKTLKVRRISAAEAASMGIELLPFDLPVSFEVRQEEDRRWVIMSSQQAVTKPYMEFLLELSWPKGSVVREFIILPSSPSSNTSVATPSASQDRATLAQANSAQTHGNPAQTQRNPAQTEAAVQSSSSTLDGQESANEQLQQKPVSQNTTSTEEGRLSQFKTISLAKFENSNEITTNKSADAPYTRFSSVPSRYVIQPGDILSRVARDWGRSTGQSSAKLTRRVTRWLIKNNPQIFENNKINRLIVGKELTFPTPEEMGLDDVELNFETKPDAPAANIVKTVPPKPQSASKKLASDLPQENTPDLNTKKNTEKKEVRDQQGSVTEPATSTDKTTAFETLDTQLKKEAVKNTQKKNSTSDELLAFMGKRINELVNSNNRHEERWLALHNLQIHPAFEAYSVKYPEEALDLRESYEGILSDAFDQTLEMNTNTENVRIAKQSEQAKQAFESNNLKNGSVLPRVEPVASKNQINLPDGLPTNIDPTITNSAANNSRLFGLASSLIRLIGFSLVGLLICLGIFLGFRHMRKSYLNQSDGDASTDFIDLFNSNNVEKAAVELETPEWYKPNTSFADDEERKVEEHLTDFVNQFDSELPPTASFTPSLPLNNSTSSNNSTSASNTSVPNNSVDIENDGLSSSSTIDSMLIKEVDNNGASELNTASESKLSKQNDENSETPPPKEPAARELDLKLDVNLINQLINEDFTEGDNPIDIEKDLSDLEKDLENAPLITDSIEEISSTPESDLSMMGSDLGPDALPFDGNFLNMDDEVGGSDKVASLISDIELYLEIGQLDKARNLLKELAKVDDDPRVTAAIEEFGSILNFK